MVGLPHLLKKSKMGEAGSHGVEKLVAIRDKLKVAAETISYVLLEANVCSELKGLLKEEPSPLSAESKDQIWRLVSNKTDSSFPKM
jgi:hypothetical protein